jgi:ATP-binding cassette subfamily C protein
MRGRGRELRVLAAWSILEAVPAFLSGRLVAQATDHGFLVRRPATGFVWLSVLGVSVVVGSWATRQMLRGLAAVVEPFRDRLVTDVVTGALHRSTLSGASPDTAAVGRLTQHVEIVRDAYAGVLGVVQTFLVTTVSALLGLLTLIPAALVLVVPPLLVGLALFAGALSRTATHQRASILADERIAEAVTTVAGGLRDVVACGGEVTAAVTIGEQIDAQARATWELARLTAVRSLAIAIGGWLPLVLILAGGTWLVRNGATTGAILGALMYVLQGVHPALQTLARGLGGSGLWLIITLGRITAEANVVGEDHRGAGDDEPVAAGRPGPGSPRLLHSDAPYRGDIRLHNVTFRYGPAAQPVVSGLHLAVGDGDHLAVVGPSGVGKSTLAGLMAGLLQPEMGEVRIGGVTVQRCDRLILGRRRVLIPQEAYVFAGTLRENLAYLRPDVRLAEIDAAVDRLGMRPLVERLGGFDADMQPLLLSAGERQLITLARAYVAPAPLVILDEATCHLDLSAEARVEQVFASRPGTLVVVAHRISSALRARRILVMDGTRTIVGTHDELLARSELYRDLVGLWLSGASAV